MRKLREGGGEHKKSLIARNYYYRKGSECQSYKLKKVAALILTQSQFIQAYSLLCFPDSQPFKVLKSEILCLRECFHSHG